MDYRRFRLIHADKLNIKRLPAMTTPDDANDVARGCPDHVAGKLQWLVAASRAGGRVHLFRVIADLRNM